MANLQFMSEILTGVSAKLEEVNKKIDLLLEKAKIKKKDKE